MKAYEGVEVDPHFPDLGTSWRWSASRPGRFTPGERAPGTHWIGDGVGPRNGLDDMKRKFLTPPEFELRPLCLSARSQSLSRLPGDLISLIKWLFGFHKGRGIPRPTQWLSASQERLYCMMSVWHNVSKMNYTSPVIRQKIRSNSETWTRKPIMT
jgi:hypothetical protein